MGDAAANGPLVFQIGFNRCATGAFFKLFQNSGVTSLHHCGRKHRMAGDMTLLNVNPQKLIDRNIRRGRPPVEGLEKYTGFFDMEYTDQRRRIENYRYFERFAEAYPDALFIMNTRDKDDWLKSRIAHNDGKYLTKMTELYGISQHDVVQTWAEHYDTHTAQVEAYFGRHSDRCLWFDLDHDDVDKAVRFFMPHHRLNPKRWKQSHPTDWNTIVAAYAVNLHGAYAAARGGDERAARLAAQ